MTDERDDTIGRPTTLVGRLPRMLTKAPRFTLVGAVAIVILALTACSSGGTGGGAAQGNRPATSKSSPSAAATSAASPSSPPSTTAGQPVRIRTLNSDGVVYGVGMPVIAYFSRKLTDARALQAKTTASVNGKPIEGAWYFEYSSANKGFPVEGHFRPQKYWPANSEVSVKMPVQGLPAGAGMTFANSLTLDFKIGPSNITTVDASTNTVTLVSDGKKIASAKTSLGDPTGRGGNKRTKRGIKVIMEKGRDISMRGPGYFTPHVKFTQRLTYGGEYLHAAPWNVANIRRGVDTSNGCTNLLPTDAERLYGLLRVGDIVTYPNADGPVMQLGEGYGDWNVTWSEWQTGGLVTTR